MGCAGDDALLDFGVPQEKKLYGLSCYSAGVVYLQIAQDVFQVEGIAGGGRFSDAVLFGEFFHPQKAMKILILSTISECDWAGTEEVWFQFAKYALENRHQVLLAADWQIARSSQVDELKLKGMIVSNRRRYRPMRLYLLKQRFIPNHGDAIRFQPDLCLINAGSPLDLEYNFDLKIFLQKLSCKKVFYCHFNSDRLLFNKRNEVSDTLQSMSGVIFVNNSNKNQLEVQLGRKVNNAHVILNSSRLNLVTPLQYPSLDHIYFANVARLDSFWKGQDLLPQILSSPEWKSRNWNLELFGSGQDQNYISTLINQFQLTHKIRISGY